MSRIKKLLVGRCLEINVFQTFIQPVFRAESPFFAGFESGSTVLCLDPDPREWFCVRIRIHLNGFVFGSESTRTVLCSDPAPPEQFCVRIRIHQNSSVLWIRIHQNSSVLWILISILLLEGKTSPNNTK